MLPVSYFYPWLSGSVSYSSISNITYTMETQCSNVSDLMNKIDCSGIRKRQSKFELSNCQGRILGTCFYKRNSSFGQEIPATCADFWAPQSPHLGLP